MRAELDDAWGNKGLFAWEFLDILNNIMEALFVAGVSIIDKDRFINFLKLETVWGRVDVFKGSFDGLRRYIKHESHTDGGGKILEIVGTKERGGEGVGFIFVFKREVDTFRGELMFTDVEVGLRVDEGVSFN